jgi:hypothetical protein
MIEAQNSAGSKDLSIYRDLFSAELNFILGLKITKVIFFG